MKTPITQIEDISGQLFDELLVVHIQSGSKRAAQKLAKRWQPRLLRTARRLLQSDELAQSATQEAWLSILGGITSLRNASRFAPWAFGILKRRCADHIRKEQRGREIFSAEPLPENTATAPRQDDAAAISQAFGKLPSEQRLAAHLYFVEGLKLAEVAQVQNIPLGTAKSRIFHARCALKTALQATDLKEKNND